MKNYKEYIKEQFEVDPYNEEQWENVNIEIPLWIMKCFTFFEKCDNCPDVNPINMEGITFGYEPENENEKTFDSLLEKRCRSCNHLLFDEDKLNELRGKVVEAFRHFIRKRHLDNIPHFARFL